MRCDYEVIVVGAGPGGSTAAAYCARAGLKTLLIEKERMPRYKACGGCLSVKTLRLLDVDPSPVIENRVYGAKFTYGLKDPFHIESIEPMGFMVMRERFDPLMVQRALQEGVEFLEGEKVTRVDPQGDRVGVELKKGRKLFCAYLIGADGGVSTVARSVSLKRARQKQFGMGLESEVPFEGAPDFPEEQRTTVHLDFGAVPFGYAWVFPKRDGLSIGVGGMFQKASNIHPRRFFDDFIRGLKFVDEKQIGRVVGHPLPCFYDGGEPVSRGRVLLVGDAADLMDPLTGEGIYYAIRSGKLAAEAIVRSREKGMDPAPTYQGALQNEIYEDLRWAFQVSRIIYRFTKVSYRTLKQYPELGYFCLQVLAGQIPYRQFVVKVKKRIKDLLKGELGDRIRRTFART
jgi:geranylgeranyl reductase family protein